MGEVMRIHVKSTRPDGHWRCGVLMTPSGGTFDVYEWPPVPGGFSIAELARLQKDPRLSVTIVAQDEPAPVDPEEALNARLDEVIRHQLTAEDYGTSGNPSVGALREALPDDKEAITAALRDQVWGEMVAKGFKAPSA